MNKVNSEYRKPSERAARFILSVFGWLGYIFGSRRSEIPHGKAIQHQGLPLPKGRSLHYPVILIVEDDPNRAQEIIDTVREHYTHGSVLLLVAHAYDAAVTFFENENVALVIMDADLDDLEGDGVILTQLFLREKPDLPILANSSSAISNLKLTGYGARETTGKNQEKLKGWLQQHEPAG